MEIVDKIIKYENGEMNQDETVEFYQEIIDSGMVWKLQGSYHRMANTLISQGFCTKPE